MVKPSALATRAIETASSPSALAMSTAAETMRSTSSSARGPRLPGERRPQRISRAGGSRTADAVGRSGMAAIFHRRVLAPFSVRRIQFVYDVHSSARGPHQELRPDPRPRRRGPPHRDRHHLRAARSQRRRQDHAGPDPRRPWCDPTRAPPWSPGTTSSPTPTRVRRSIGLTGQYAAVDDVLTGEENLLMMARLRKLSASAARRRTAELLEEFDLVDAAGRRAGTYSGGMKRRLDLAVSMIERPSAALPRRADDRARPTQPRAGLGDGQPAQGRGRDRAAHHPVPRGGRPPGRPRRRARRRPHRRRGDPRAAQVDRRGRAGAARAGRPCVVRRGAARLPRRRPPTRRC